MALAAPASGWPSGTRQETISTSDTVTVYTPSSELTNPGQLVAAVCRSLWDGRELAWRLFVRDVSALYRQSLLGYVWAFLPPLATAAPYIFLSSQKIVNFGATPVPYPVYVIIGTMLWQSFTDALNSSIRVVASNRNLLTRLNFPREALVVAGLFDVIFNSLVRLFIIAPAMWYFHVPVGASLLLFPVGLMALILLGLSIGLFLTPLSLLYTDIARGLAFFTAFWMLLTPVIYPPAKGGLAALLNTFNPASPVLVTTRDWLTAQPALHVGGLVAVGAGSLVLLFVSILIYRVALPHLIERMGG